MNQKGAILPSVVFFLAITLLLVLGATRIYLGQMQQFLVLNNYYQSKSLATLAKKQLEKSVLISKQSIKKVTIIYTIGKVTLTNQENQQYLVEVQLENNHIFREMYSLQANEF